MWVSGHWTARQMKTIIAAIAEYDRQIEALCQTHDDYHLFAALPGAGPVHAARLTAALGSDRTRWQTVDELLRFSGIASIIERSGKQFRTRWRGRGDSLIPLRLN